MDPITAVQCASAVLSFVDFSVRLISKGKEIYKSTEGVLRDHAEQDAIAQRLSVLSNGLVLTIETTSKVKNLTPAERTLKQIAEECSKIALDFASAIDNIRITGKHRIWKSFRQAFKSLWNKEQIEQKHLQLERLRHEILTHLLVVMHDSQQDLSKDLPVKIDSASKAIIDAVKAQRDELKDSLDVLSNTISAATKRPVHQMTGLFDKQTVAVDEIRRISEQWLPENQQILENIVRQLQTQREERINTQLHRELLKSLAFEQMYDRLDAIGPKAQETFEWVISDSVAESVPWTDLHMWLQSDKGLYWIAGKAGSGKSTMTKWLAEDLRTRTLLETWANGRQLLILKYYFWNSGTTLQSSSTGFFRSLLHDLLLQYPSVISAVSPARSRSADLELNYVPPWSIEELISTIETVLGLLSKSSAVCFVIDGLDECVEEERHRERTLTFINQIRHKSFIKVITSSRPLHDIEFELQVAPDLRLEDLTTDDINTYVKERLICDRRFTDLRVRDTDLAHNLAIEITTRAEGVFLWVKIVVESLLRGLRNQDTASDLSRRIRETPPELMGLFAKMLSAVEKVYLVKVLRLLKLVLEHSEPPSLMTCSFLDDFRPLSVMNGQLDNASVKDIQQRLSTSKLHIKAQCLGLLEVRPGRVDNLPSSEIDATSRLCYSEVVEFLHSTAREYLTQNADLFCQSKEIADFDTNAFMVEALLAQMKLSKSISLRPLFDLLSIVSQMPRPLSEHIITLLIHLDEILSMQDLPTDEEARYTCRRCNLDGQNPLLSMAICYDIFEYVKVVIASQPQAVTRGRRNPLLLFALKRRREEFHILIHRVPRRVYPPIHSDDVPNPDMIKLLLMQGADPNASINWYSDEDAGTFQLGGVVFIAQVYRTVWTNYMDFVRIERTQIQGQHKQAVEAWFISTKLLLDFGAAHHPSVLPRSQRYYGSVPFNGLEVAFGIQARRELDSIAFWRYITFRNFGRYLVVTMRSLFQPSRQKTLSGWLILRMLGDFLYVVSITFPGPILLFVAFRQIAIQQNIFSQGDSSRIAASGVSSVIQVAISWCLIFLTIWIYARIYSSMFVWKDETLLQVSDIFGGNSASDDEDPNVELA